MQGQESISEMTVKGAIVGLIVGDALGYPYENHLSIRSVDMIKGSHGESVGWWTSSSAFTIATMSSINDMEKIDPEDILDRFNNVLISGFACPEQECKDISKITSEAIENFTNGMPFDKCGVIGNNDNDCLLRILPISLYSARMPLDDIMSNVHLVCSLTHNDPYSQTCCFIYSLIVRNLLLGKAEKVFDTSSQHYKDNNMYEHADCVDKLKNAKAWMSENPKDISTTFWSAWAAYSNNQSDYAMCVSEAIMSASDRNGAGLLSGSFSGLTNGLNDIPSKWLRHLKLDAECIDIMQNFIDRIIVE